MKTVPALIKAARATSLSAELSAIFRELKQVWPGWICNEALFIAKMAAIRRAEADRAGGNAGLHLTPVGLDHIEPGATYLAAVIGGTTAAFRLVQHGQTFDASAFTHLFRIDHEQNPTNRTTRRPLERRSRATKNRKPSQEKGNEPHLALT